MPIIDGKCKIVLNAVNFEAALSSIPDHSTAHEFGGTDVNINGANLVAGGAQNSALLLVAIVGANITSNMIYDDTGNMYRAITESGACDYNLIHANTWGGGSGTTTILGANSVESDNIALS